MEDTKPKKEFKKPEFLDDFFSDCFSSKASVRPMIVEGNMEGFDTSKLASAVYETTFARAFDMDFSCVAKNKQGEVYVGATDIGILEREAASYFNGYELNGTLNNCRRLARPAFWYLTRNVLKFHEDAEIYSIRDDIIEDPSRIVREYETYIGQRDKFIDYLVANVKAIRGEKNG